MTAVSLPALRHCAVQEGEYLPVLSRTDPGLRQYLDSVGLLGGGTDRWVIDYLPLPHCVAQIRRPTGRVSLGVETSGGRQPG